jgi:hypothetical protein
MASSTETPDLLGSLSNALGLNRLWQSDEQADAENRKSEQEGEPLQTEPPTNKTLKDPESRENSGEASVSIAKEREKERARDQEEVDNNDGIQGVSAPLRLQAQPRKGTDAWPMPVSFGTNQAEKPVDSGPSKDDNSALADENPETSADGGGSKSYLMPSLIPFLGQQQREPAENVDAAGEGQPSQGVQDPGIPKPFSRRQSVSSSSEQPLRRPNRRFTRQSTTPAHLAPDSDDNEGSRSISAARSRWISVTHGLRFPLRRRKTDKQAAATKGTEVVTSLIAGAPAATLIGTSMVPDERGHNRIPFIVGLLKVMAPQSFCQLI